MSAVQEIKWAIEKLTLFKEQLGELVWEGLATPLELTWFTTIDAQLAILKDSIIFDARYGSGIFVGTVSNKVTLELARAINGTESH